MAEGEDRVLKELGQLAKLLGSEIADRFEVDCEDFLTACDQKSPIEQLMGAALFYATKSPNWFGGEARENACWYGVPEDKRLLERVPSFPGIDITPQASIGRYKADFLIFFAGWRGGYVWGAVECDGHDHHNLTKKQAQHDRERDRFFQNQGVTILRYTGSEIWASPLKCAADALTTLEKLADGDTARKWRARA